MPAIEEYPPGLDEEGYSDVNALYVQPFWTSMYYLLVEPKLEPGYIHHRILIVAIGVVVAGAFSLFTDLKRLAGRLVAGSLHGGAHYLAALFLAWAGARLAFQFVTPNDFDP